ncbi:MAG: hypothetical protein CMN73_16845 [Sphingomonas sp.]|nr:hypothetical protein [Sphingomonas sp.]|tara:strand:- start:630 stop:1253 length:624 start_codon:yes stop_codon:yes gene_type:complete
MCPAKRSSDPGTRLFEYRADWGNVVWVHCPECRGPARETQSRLVCIKCGYNHGAKDWVARAGQMVQLIKWDTPCERCRAPIPNRGHALRGGTHAGTRARVRCLSCGHRGIYRAHAFRSAAHFKLGNVEPRRPYLSRRIGGHSLWVLNLAHLDALENWLAAGLRERGSRSGLTMMARLPRWMKAASNRHRVIRALAEMREEAKAAGID